jgi:hypothetical protein
MRARSTGMASTSLMLGLFLASSTSSEEMSARSSGLRLGGSGL